MQTRIALNEQRNTSINKNRCQQLALHPDLMPARSRSASAVPVAALKMRALLGQVLRAFQRAQKPAVVVYLFIMFMVTGNIRR